MSRFILGKMAECKVRDYLQKLGWKFLAQNYRGVGFELDLVFEAPHGVLVGVEVKFRKFVSHEVLSQLLSSKKINSLRQGLIHFITKNKKQYEVIRIDLVLLTGTCQKIVLVHHEEDVQL